MTYNEFKVLPAEEQVTLVNNMLKTMTTDEVAVALGMSKTTLSNRMKDANHSFSRTTNSYDPMVEGMVQTRKVPTEGVNVEAIVEAVLARIAPKLQSDTNTNPLDFTLIQDLPRSDNNIRTINLPNTIWFQMEALSKKYSMYKKGDLFALALSKFLLDFELEQEEIDAIKKNDESKRRLAVSEKEKHNKNEGGN